jgi:hypothetical protein
MEGKAMIETLSAWEKLQSKVRHRNPDTYAHPFYVVNHVNLACIGIPMKHCPCSRGWLCDGIWGNKQSMSNRYDQEQQALRKEHFGDS